jgi:FKBP-type peptidyl-prolyl cis-trans isomerase FkpA
VKQLTFAIAFIATIISISSCKNNASFKTLKPGIEYKIFNKATNKTLVKSGDFVKMHIIQRAGDSTFMSTFDRGEPVLNKLEILPNQPGLDPTPVFFKMAAGDSAVIRLNPDSAFGKNKPPFLKATDEVLIIVKMVEILNKQQADSMNALQAKMMSEQQSQQAEMQKKQAENAIKLKPIEDAKIKSYITSKGLNATKTSSGLYYVITTPGSGANAASGQSVSMKYTGSTLAGVKFDSNTDPAFGHMEPLTFALGTGRVIPGWDEGISYFNKGAKGFLLVPSYLAYGENPPPGGKMKANEILAFEVEVLDIK